MFVYCQLEQPSLHVVVALVLVRRTDQSIHLSVGHYVCDRCDVIHWLELWMLISEKLFSRVKNLNSREVDQVSIGISALHDC